MLSLQKMWWVYNTECVEGLFCSLNILRQARGEYFSRTITLVLSAMKAFKSYASVNEIIQYIVLLAKES